MFISMVLDDSEMILMTETYSQCIANIIMAQMFARTRNCFNLINHDYRQARFVTGHALDLIKRLTNSLATLPEPPAEQAICTQLHERRVGKVIVEPDREFLAQRLCKSRFTDTWGPMK